jgi:hypothetical protein
VIVPSIGTTAKFIFVSPFNVLNGIYTLTHLVSFESAIDDGVNFVDYLYSYTAYSDPDESFASDWKNYKEDQVLKLASIEDPDRVIFVPSRLIDEVPDPQIIKAYDMTLRVSLGVFQDPSKITWIVNELNDFVAGSTGTDKTCKLFSPQVKWMTQTEWDVIEQARQANIQNMDLQSKKIQDLNTLITSLQTKVQKYEEKIIALSQTP